MNTYPCAELGAKHDYSCITATRTLRNGSDVRYMLSEDIDIDIGGWVTHPQNRKCSYKDT